ncbi:MAG: hypothetical protein ACM3OB_02005 [Acidobacteriota bacterium]
MVAFGAQAQDKCSVKGVLAGKSFAMGNCAVAYFDGEQAVTLWFDEKPIAPQDAEKFQASSDAPENRRLIQLAFCPGGGEVVADAKAVKSVEMLIQAGGLLDRQWVFHLPADAGLKIERLSGKLELGGRLAGRITGQRESEGAYSWEIDFDVKLPAKGALAGPGCS